MELQKNRTGVEAKFYELCSKVVPENGLQLYDMDYVSGSYTLKVFVLDESTGTAVIEDCVKVDRALTPFIDELEWVPEQLILEVSSPGMFRDLKQREHFESAVGQKISCTITGKLPEEAVAGAPKKIAGGKKFRGDLLEINDNEIVLDIDGFKLPISFEQLKKANLDPDY
jgi:ribosome maturation factor RimP